jgi:hypothetical protein
VVGVIPVLVVMWVLVLGTLLVRLEITYKVQYYVGCDPFMGLSYFNYGRKPALFSSSQFFFYGDIAAGH